jgi:hypothetical protein
MLGSHFVAFPATQGPTGAALPAQSPATTAIKSLASFDANAIRTDLGRAGACMLV